MHDALLLTHSWLRWVILAGGVYVTLHILSICLTRRPWRGGDNYLVWAFGRAFLYQALFGLLLYIMLSANQSATLLTRELDNRLGHPVHWPLIHGLGMIVSLAFFYAVKALVYRRVSLAHRPIALLILMLGTLAIIIASIPWPFLKFGRPLFRLP